MIAISGCLSAPSNKEMEEFAEKVIKVAEQLNKLRKEFIESLNQTSNEKILEEYTTKGVYALNQKFRPSFPKESDQTNIKLSLIIYYATCLLKAN